MTWDDNIEVIDNLVRSMGEDVLHPDIDWNCEDGGSTDLVFVGIHGTHTITLWLSKEDNDWSITELGKEDDPFAKGPIEDLDGLRAAIIAAQSLKIKRPPNPPSEA